MPEPKLIPREVAVVDGLARLAAERARAEATTAATFSGRAQAAQRDYEGAVADLHRRAEAETSATQAEYDEARRRANARAEADTSATQAEYEAARRKAAAGHESGKEAAERARDEARWQALAVYESAVDAAKKQYEADVSALNEEIQVFAPVEMGAGIALARFARLAGPDAAGPDLAGALPTEGAAFAELFAALRARDDAAEEHLDALARLALPKLLHWGAYPWPFLLLAAALAYPAYLALGWPTGPAAALIGAVALGLAIRPWLRGLARRRVDRHYRPLAGAIAARKVLAEKAGAAAVAGHKLAREQANERREAAAQAGEEAMARRLDELAARREEVDRKIEATYPPRLEQIARDRAEALRRAEDTYPPRLERIAADLDEALRRLAEEYERTAGQISDEHRAAWDALFAAWRDGLARLTGEADAINAAVARASFDWAGHPPEEWTPQTEVPPALRFGDFTVEMAAIPDGMPLDDRLRAVTPEAVTMPALLPFPEQGSLLLKAFDDGKDAAIDLQKAVMLRYLTSVPPAKVRFTIVDPVGLGKNFAAFMHLADSDEQLVTSRIWTETRHIEQRLADLTEHMEVVLQKYLRDEYPTIAEYNAMAGEVAEPFRVLVVANFPVNFTEASARRLISIAQGGPRCGVQVIVTVDTRLPLPPGIQLRDLEQHATVLNWAEGKFRWPGSPFASYPLRVDAPPPPESLTKLVQRTGEAAKGAKRVEVPFEVIAPPRDRWWAGDTRSGIDVPLGRAGATRLQHLTLGRGTSQHVLIAGRTGSGKSTLLHALITNASLIYGPDELELYLIDFKKGVEFKSYATRRLPHARVVAVESEREFGLSVLQRLDDELRRRGDLFRSAGAQDLAAYRNAGGEGPMPRILLVVDEFQEFFVEDDKLSQEVALLLDRLVRQGRAFGIHVHLGSQTLSGAYSLARSTLGQMAVRIALQCSEADAHLILSEDNAAARLLSRPGEAIYNDSNGSVEGNHPFQVVWLPDERREEYLRELRELAAARDFTPDRPMIVFEGNTPADLAGNPLLAARLAEPPAEPPRAASAWLGEAIAIKDPTAAVFRRQGGANLLLLGQQDESALGIAAAALVGLSAQHPAGSARFVVLDGTPADSPHVGTLARAAEAVPHPVDLHGPRDAGAAVNALAEEVARRREAESTGEPLEAPSVFLVIHDLTRFRDLRKAEDDYGFSRYGGDDAPATTPAQNLATILREGPALGIHAIVWSDTPSNANRALDRQVLREFEMRVLFQMGANDSSNLIDTPAASRLGPNRAYYHDEEKGILEKFRPYALPDPAWLAGARDRLRVPTP